MYFNDVLIGFLFQVKAAKTFKSKKENHKKYRYGHQKEISTESHHTGRQ